MRAVVLWIACLSLAACGSGEDRPAADTTAAATATTAPQPGNPAVARAAERYLTAVWRGDLEAECELSSRGERRKQGGICDIARQGRARPLQGDPPKVGEVRVQGDVAFVQAAGGVSLTLVRESGGWGVDEARGVPQRQVSSG